MPIVSELRELVRVAENEGANASASWQRSAILAMLTAAAEIERLAAMYESATLLSGAVTPGNSYRDLTEAVRRWANRPEMTKDASN